MPENESPKVIAEVISGPHAGAKFAFERHETLLVGRASIAQLRLNEDPHFSRHHFRLEVNPPECYLLDLGSRNGTFVNGKREREKFLSDGDVVSGGHTEIRFTITPAPEPLPSTQLSPDESKATTPPRPPVPGWKLPTVLADGSQAATPFKRPSTRKQQAPGARFEPIPGYEVIEQVGGGGMGFVYRAVQKATSKQVALKVMIPEHAATDDSVKLFVREANILNQLKHPRIVTSYEFGLNAGQFYLAMEYIDTIDFPALLDAQEPRARVRIACGVMCQALEALRYAHMHSVVHRDIKPSNILVYRPRSKLSAKLADFGISKNYANAGFSGITTEGQTRGTLAYIPPEQIVDSRYAKPAGDIYSAGATLYEYLTGRPPCEFSSFANEFVAVLEGTPVPIQERAPYVPDELAAVVHRALAREPLDRIASAEEMHQALLPFSKRR